MWPCVFQACDFSKRPIELLLARPSLAWTYNIIILLGCYRKKNKEQHNMSHLKNNTWLALQSQSLVFSILTFLSCTPPHTLQLWRNAATRERWEREVTHRGKHPSWGRRIVFDNAAKPELNDVTNYTWYCTIWCFNYVRKSPNNQQSLWKMGFKSNSVSHHQK